MHLCMLVYFPSHVRPSRTALEISDRGGDSGDCEL